MRIQSFAALLILLATSAFSQETDGGKHGDWQTLCDETGCRLSQSIVSAESDVTVLLVRVFAGQAPTVVMTTPLGIFLKPGLVIKVDQKRARAYSFEICDQLGCHSGIALEPDLLRDFRRGLQAEITFFDGGQNKVTVPVSLAGFTAGFESLEVEQ